MTKVCRGCGAIKPLDGFHIDRNNKKDGHKNFCITCVAERRKTPMSKVTNEKLVCSRCKRIKPRSEFSSSSRAVSGVQDWCRQCMKEYHAEYAQNNKEKLRNDAFEWYNKSPRGWASGALRSHKRKGHKINITIEELYKYSLDKKFCPICGKELSWGGKNGRIRSHSPSLDRINNESELNMNNVWIICARCNAAKGDLTMKGFIDYCKLVVKRSELALDPEKEVE